MVAKAVAVAPTAIKEQNEARVLDQGVWTHLQRSSAPLDGVCQHWLNHDFEHDLALGQSVNISITGECSHRTGVSKEGLYPADAG